MKRIMILLAFSGTIAFATILSLAIMDYVRSTSYTAEIAVAKEDYAARMKRCSPSSKAATSAASLFHSQVNRLTNDRLEQEFGKLMFVRLYLSLYTLGVLVVLILFLLGKFKGSATGIRLLDGE